MVEEALKISLIQQNIIWENPEANIQKNIEALKNIPPDTDLVLFPEAFLSGFSMNKDRLKDFTIPVDEAEKILTDWSARSGFYIGGTLFVEENGHYFNRFYIVSPEGKILNRYDKRHLFSHAGEDKIFTGGDRRVIVPLKNWKIMLQICYDLRFPVWSKNRYFRESGDYEYDMLVYVANWPALRRDAYLRLLPARAIENQSFVIWVNRTGRDGYNKDYAGDSGIISPAGKTLATLKNEEKHLNFILDKSVLNETRTRMPLGPDWDVFCIE